MGQDFQVIRCVQCLAFQVQMAKISGKFACSLCGLKQTNKKVFFQSGSSKECRQHVQQLNATRGDRHQEAEEVLLQHLPEMTTLESDQRIDHDPLATTSAGSRWTKYLVDS